MQPIAVFDTNILVSAIGWQGTPYHCLELARSGVVQWVTCPQLLSELAQVLQRKLGFEEGEVADTLADLLGFARLVTVRGELHVVAADPDDDKVIECGVEAQATHIVSGDQRHLLPLRQYRGISIVSASEFLAIVRSS